MKLYYGHQGAGEPVVLVRRLGRPPRRLGLYREVERLGETFNRGSGPSVPAGLQLALAILADASCNYAAATFWAGDFHAEVIAWLPPGRFQLLEVEILAWLEPRRHALQALVDREAGGGPRP